MTESRASGELGRSAPARKRGRIVVLGVVLGVTAALAGAALAAPLGLVSSPVGADSAQIPRCDEDGFDYSFATSGGDVTSVTVADIADPGCEGGELHVTLTDAAGNAIASGGAALVPTDGDTAPNAVTLPTTAQPPAGDIARAHTNVVGP